ACSHDAVAEHATTEADRLSLHDALPIALDASAGSVTTAGANAATGTAGGTVSITAAGALAVGNVDTHGGNSSAASTAGADGGTVERNRTGGDSSNTSGTTTVMSVDKRRG